MEFGAVVMIVLATLQSVNSYCPRPGYPLKYNKTITEAMRKQIEDPLSKLRGVCGFYNATAYEEDFVPYQQSNPEVLLRQNKTQLIPTCCPGYVHQLNDECVPVCGGSCDNGWCYRPNTCVCAEGFTINKIGDCVPECPCSCLNGNCQGDTCVCNPGYDLDSNTKSCEPVCQSGCANGRCVYPENCQCNPGYVSQDGRCIKYCPNFCENGDIGSDGHCYCKPGYVKDYMDCFCTPLCNPQCVNSECVSPYTCNCHPGYFKTSFNVCQLGNPDYYVYNTSQNQN